MDDTDEVRRAFADAKKLSFASDDEAISRLNRYLPKGMKLLNAVCEAGSRVTGELVLTFCLDDRFTNPVGFVCGGYIAQMLDQAAAYSSTFVTGKASPSLDLHVRFIAPAKPGMFMAIGKMVKAGRSIAFLEAKLFDASTRLIATGTVAAQLIPGSEPAETAARACGREPLPFEAA